jgi:hypothetical protein
MSEKKLGYGGYIKVCDTTTKMSINLVPKDCFPYSFDGNINDTVELNKLKQQYNCKSYQFIYSPHFGPCWKSFVDEKVKQIGLLSNNMCNITGYVSFSFRVNCLHGCFVADENTSIPNECNDCFQNRLREAGDWESY